MSRPGPARRFLLGLDALGVIAFVAIGRDTHDRESTLAGLAGTAAPFLIALAAGWLAARAWRSPASLRTGAIVWAVTLAGGMLARRLVVGDGTAPAFVLVAAAFLAAFLFGWRMAAARFG